ncbi:MAG: hypothetical protein IKQ60_09895 [Candidatus Methanomethylophilaceae archaeon]|nr:hypothetical protein [Candidatus Methanomethylophilaceae archaeon]
MALPLNGAMLIPEIRPSIDRRLSWNSSLEKNTLAPESSMDEAAAAVFHFWYQWPPLPETTTFTSTPERADSFRKLYTFSSGTRYGSERAIDFSAAFSMATYPMSAGFQSPPASGPVETIWTLVLPAAPAVSDLEGGLPVANDQSARKRSSSLDAAGPSRRITDCSPTYAARPSTIAMILRFLKRNDIVTSGMSLLWNVLTHTPAAFMRLMTPMDPGTSHPRRTLTSAPPSALEHRASTKPGASESVGGLYMLTWTVLSADTMSATALSDPFARSS